MSVIEIGCARPLLLREEVVGDGDVGAWRIFYASDLHFTSRRAHLVERLREVAERATPDAILLGGDLLDRECGARALTRCVATLLDLAPVFAVAGNHDSWIGVHRARDAVRAGGGVWLADGDAMLRACHRRSLHLVANLHARRDSDALRVFVGHDPAVFARSLGLPETPVRPVAVVRPGTTASAFFYSTPEILSGPIPVPYTLTDQEGDMARQIVAEYSANGGGLWLPATRGTGGDPTTDLAASPGGSAHTFEWDAEADGAVSDNVVFRIAVLWQAPDHAGYPVQRPRLSAVTPPFRVGGTTCASPTGSLGNALRARKQVADVELSWPLGILSIDRFNVMRADGDKTMLDKSALPGSYTAPVSNPAEITSGSYSDSGPSPTPGTAFYYEVYGRDCAGVSIIP